MAICLTFLTKALNTSFTRSGKRTLAGENFISSYKPLLRLLTSALGVLSDATKSVSRAYINNFQDKAKQAAIDMFLVSIYYSRRHLYLYSDVLT